jgi:hypothetical protein
MSDMKQRELINNWLSNKQNRLLYLEKRIADLRDSLNFVLDNPEYIRNLENLEQLAFDAELFTSTFHICQSYED